MNIKPLAFESLGTRGMATSVVTRDCILLIDPGVNLASQRFGLPPHPMEVERKKDHWAKIKDYAEHSDIIILTHYHFDHFNPDEPQIFGDKTVILKDPRAHLNRNQRIRAEKFLKKLKGLPRELLIADGQEYTFGETRLRFSPAVSHGPGRNRGTVVQVAIREDGTFVHTSDVQGPSDEDQVRFLVQEDAETVFCDGPATYLLGKKYPLQSFRKAMGFLKEILAKTGVRQLVLDHHLPRDWNWKGRLRSVFDEARARDVELLTAAGFAGIEDDLLEARRRRLYGR
jgi:predicted metallo-beta-lactamase superfamily hydrolase